MPVNTPEASVQFSSVAQSCPTLCDPMNRSTPGLPVHHQHWSSLRLTSIEAVMPSSHLILCRPLLLLPSIPPSIRVFSNDSILHIRCPKYWSFSFSISLSNEYSGLISFRVDWLHLPAVQEILKSLSWRIFHFVVIHTVKGYGIVSEAEVDVFLEYSCFFYDLVNVGWRRQWHPPPVFLPGKSHGWRSLVGCSPWGR